VQCACQSAEDPRVAELIDLTAMTSRMTVAKTKVLAWHCRICGSVPVSRRTRKGLALRERLGMKRSVWATPARCNESASVTGNDAYSPEFLMHRDLLTLAWFISLQQK
jgi:hypothetical protein